MKHARLHITDTNPLNLCAMVELWLDDLEVPMPHNACGTASILMCAPDARILP